MSSFVPFKINKRPKDSNSPKSANQKANLHVRLVEAIGLPSADILGSSDPYCKVYLKDAPKSSNIFNKPFKSDFIKKCTDPIFNTSTSIEVFNADLAKGSLQIHLFDHDKINTDTELGIASVPLSHFKTNEFFQGWLSVRPSEEHTRKQNNQQEKKQQNNTTIPEKTDTNTKTKTATTDQKPAKKKKFGMFSKKNIGGMMSSVKNNKALNNMYQKTSKALETGAEVAKNVAGHVADQVTEALQQQGKRSREHGRIYVVIRYEIQKKASFEQKENNSKHLQIIHNPCKPTPIKVFSFTFNAGNCNLPDFNDSLSQWLPPNNENIDLYVLGFQELNQKKKGDKKDDDSDDDDSDDDEEEEYNETEMKQDNNNKQNEIQYEDNDQQIILNDYFLKYLGKDYVCISHRNMWQTRLFIYTKKKYGNVISNVISDFAATGIAGFGPNKGGVAIAFDFDGISLCFLSCHLAAHQKKLKQRNGDYSKICKNLKIGSSKQQLLGQFHCIILMGDLNYRVDFFGEKHENKPEENVYKKACGLLDKIGKKKGKNKYNEILKNDQLNNSIKGNEAFIGFNELSVGFAPTFKMERKSGMYYINKRLPAWCDRILWKCCDGINIKANGYKMYNDVSVSDHKPVSCVFSIGKWERSCGISDECKKAMICFRNVSGIDLKVIDTKHGKTDPFVYFPKQLLLEKYIQSKSVNDIPVLGLMRNSLPFLENVLLMFQIRDRVQRSVMDMDVIGYGYIELRKCVKKLNKWIGFEQEVTLNGMKAGVFKGEIKLEYESKKK